ATRIRMSPPTSATWYSPNMPASAWSGAGSAHAAGRVAGGPRRRSFTTDMSPDGLGQVGRVPGNDRLEVGIARERAEGKAPLPAEARSAKCVAHRSRGVAGEQPSLENQSHAIRLPTVLARYVLGGAI